MPDVQDNASPGAGRSSGDLPMRLAAGFTLGPLGVFAIYFGGLWLTIAAFLCGAAMWWEWRRLVSGETRYAGLLFGAAIIGAACGLAPSEPLVAAAFLAMGGFSLEIAERVVGRGSSASFSGLLYCGLPPAALVLLRDAPGGSAFLPLALLGLVWITDIAAYFAGRGFGGPRLSPKDSPNKTWSGTVGALICSALAGAAIAAWRDQDPVFWIAFALGISLIAQAGDLFESHLKRRFGVKDTSQLIPGHGGAMDRLDSLSAVCVAMGVLILAFPDLSLFG